MSAADCSLAKFFGLATFLLFGFTGCKKRSFSEGNLSSSGSGQAQNRFGPLILLRDRQRLPSAEQSTVAPKEVFDPAGFVVAEEVPVKGIALLREDAIETDSFEAENAAGEKVKVKKIDATERVAMKPGGWWVTPIHGTLVAETGEVLLTGWGRQDRDQDDFSSGTSKVCDGGTSVFHSGKRRYGVTFLFNPSAELSPKSNSNTNSAVDTFVYDSRTLTYLVKGIREAVNPSESSFERQVYYCSGQVPLSDGKIFYTGGSKYRNLGAYGMHRELLMYKENGREIKVEFNKSNSAHQEILRNKNTNGAKIFIDAAPELDEVEFGVDYPKIFDANSPVQASTGRQSFNALTHLGYLSDLGPDVSTDASVPGIKRVNTMWYPTNTRLPGSRVLTVAGTYRWSANRNIANRSFQIFDYKCFLDPSHCNGKPAWLGLSRHDYTPEEIAPGIRDYIHSFLLPKPVSLQCNGSKKKNFHVAVSGWPGNFYLVDTESTITQNTSRVQSEAAARFCKAPNGQRPAGASTSNGAHGWNSSSALIYTGEIFRVGGYFDPRVSQRVDIYNPYAEQNCVNFRELSENKIESCPAYRFINTGITRESPATVLLPDGKVLITNGWADGQQFEKNAKNYSQQPEARAKIQIVDPVPGLYDERGITTGKLFSQPFPETAGYDEVAASAIQSEALFNEIPWTDPTLSPFEQATHTELNHERGYHNLALLLKDGRVLVGGGTHSLGAVGCERPSLQIYSPPYLDNPEKRPAFAAAYSKLQLTVGSNSPIVIKYKGDKLFSSKPQSSSFGKSGVALMAPGSFTHGFNQNQRYVGLSYKIMSTSANETQIQIDPPRNEFIAPEGEYLLFLVTESGIPSVGLKVTVKGKE